jgi:hypothetical protein
VLCHSSATHRQPISTAPARGAKREVSYDPELLKWDYQIAWKGSASKCKVLRFGHVVGLTKKAHRMVM